MRVQGRSYRSVWLEGAVVRLIDQRLLPHQFAILDCPTSHDTAQAIVTMAVRGAGAIGAAAGFGMAQAALGAPQGSFASSIEQAARMIRSTRPTARDLFYAVECVEASIRQAPDLEAARRAAVQTAQRLADENAAAGEQIGLAGEPLLQDGANVMTQCNAGWLAFADWGSALAPIYQAQRRGKRPFVYVPETRPRGQGAKLTAWELGQEGVSHALIADTACGTFIQRGEVDCLLVGADRIAANGDVANKIGTYTLAVLADRHHVPFYVAAPRSTFDLSTPTGAAIVIEERGEEEVLWVWGRSADDTWQRVQISPAATRARNPAFDVTPAALVTAFITEAGLIPPRPDAIEAFVRRETALPSA
ncbi:MAG: S-methyl-5-thioribose-1-phosphate isomerase [Candidatus Omnitrophica bacterium]|nr:S-methyl-5-thioribose-1-phosphate isomerase [Candidatus Omnitrophota bacterium]